MYFVIVLPLTFLPSILPRLLDIAGKSVSNKIETMLRNKDRFFHIFCFYFVRSGTFVTTLVISSMKSIRIEYNLTEQTIGKLNTDKSDTAFFRDDEQLSLRDNSSCKGW